MAHQPGAIPPDRVDHIIFCTGERYMQTRFLVVGAVAVLLAQAGFAASPDRCTRLEGKFDQQVSTSTSAELAQAKTLRADGAKLCTSGKKAEGVKKLEEAVKMLGGGAATHK